MLFTLDRRPLEAALEQARGEPAARHGAGGEREVAGAALSGSRRSAASPPRSRSTRRRRPPRRSRPRVAADRAAVENAKVQLQYATITAPISGRTGALMVHEGNLVRANDTTPLVVINQVAPIYVVVRHSRSAAAGVQALHGAGVAEGRGARAQRRPARRRSAASRSSTTRSTRRPARSGSRARSRTRTPASGRASSSTSSSR